MKTILISIPYGMSARNHLRSDSYRLLRSQCNVVILSSLANDAAFQAEFGGPNVHFHPYIAHRTLRRRLIEPFLVPLQAFRFTLRSGITSLEINRRWVKRTQPVRYFGYWLLGNTVGRIPSLIRALERIYGASLVNPFYRTLLKERRVDLVFTTHGFVDHEFEVAATAKSLGIPVVDMIHSWDNITSKSGLRLLAYPRPGRVLPVQFFDRIIVWNDILKQELVDHYLFPERKIYVAGVPQFDVYISPDRFPSRENFMKRLGADPALKTILYCAPNPRLAPAQLKILKSLAEALPTLTPPAQLIIRSHPGTDVSDWKAELAGPHVHFFEPSPAYHAAEMEKGWQSDRTAEFELASGVYHGDVLVNMNSTTTIDAAVFDRPVVCLAFDGRPEPDYFTSVRKFYDYTHYEKIVRTGGFKIARNQEELLAFIQQYLENPSLDAAGRDRIRKEQAYRLDGKAGERIGRYLLAMLEERTS